MTDGALPIHEALPALLAALAERSCAVLIAPPGAGKTTVVPLALLDAPWRGDGRILVLEPRRLAARAAAARMAATLGERVGETVGYRVRLESRVTAATRIEVVTEGVFTRMILDDPALDGVAAVILDEFHERSLDADLGLALARDTQKLLREDLRLLVMSATLDGGRVAALLDDAPVVESRGRAFPVETRHLGRDPALRFEADVARGVRRALSEEPGSLLVFLPGAAEIRRVQGLLEESLRDPAVRIAPLYGALPPAEQDRAIAPAPPGTRKVVLATSIAETSLTIEGVRGVVDGGLSRVPRYDPARGLTRLETVRVSRAAAEQRRGRAGRTQPGVCWRLWDEAETRALPLFDRPEVLEADLAGLALDLARWGARDAAGLDFLDPPPAAAFAEARALLAGLEALDGDGALTPHGRRMAELPLPPRLAHMLLRGAEAGGGRRAAELAALLTERGLGGAEVEVGERRAAWARERGPRADDARALARRWAALARGREAEAPPSDGALLALAFPERVAQARGARGGFRLASGRGAQLDGGHPLAEQRFLAVAELGSGAAQDRILTAAPLTREEIEALFALRITVKRRLEPTPSGALKLREARRLGALVLEARWLDHAAPEQVAEALLAQLRAEGLDALPWGEAARALQGRAAFLREADGEGPDLSDAALLARLDDWAPPLLAGRARLADVPEAALEQALLGLLTYEQRRRLDAEAPTHLLTPAGARAPIDYAAPGGPTAEVRVQALYGLDRHPTVGGGRTPLTLALTSPAGRPVQVTRDLPGFWRGSWSAVRAEMRGRYPRRPWPEQPWLAEPTLRAKPRGT